MSNVCDEDRAGARKVLDSLKSQSCSNPKEVSLRSYGKYEQLIFGTEYEDRESDDPTFGLKGKAPKANLCRKKWSDEEEAEIAAGVDLASMEQQPDSFVARELLNKSRVDGGVIYGARSGSSLKNKLIRAWKMIRKNKDA